VTRRTERVAEEIREEVARILAREIKDPRIGFVTITRATITPDLRVARIYVGVLGDETQRRKTLSGLAQATGFIRRAVAHHLRLRIAPELSFEYDEGLDATDRVARLLESAVRPPGEEDS
jgi:ribosome-binding factor A